MKVASGTVLDRPWGQTLGTVALRKLTGQVTVRAEDGKAYSIGFVGGNVVAGASPLPNDSVTRVALTSHFISPAQVGDITRRLAAETDRDEVDVVVEAGKLSADHAKTLRRRLVMQRAARTFAIDRGEFEIEDQLALPVVRDFHVPLGAVIFQGVRMNLSEQRLAQDLRELGSAFRMRPTATDDDIARLEFDLVTAHIVDALRVGAALAELEGTHRDIEPRTLHSMLYALVCTGLCDATGGQPVDRTAPVAPRTGTISAAPTNNHTTIRIDQPLVTRQTRASVVPVNMPRTLSQQGAEAPRPVRTTSVEVTPRTSTPTSEPRTRSIDVTPRLNISRTQTPTVAPSNVPTSDLPRTTTPTTPPTTVPRTTSLTSTPRTTTPTAAPATARPTSSTSAPRTTTPTAAPNTMPRPASASGEMRAASSSGTLPRVSSGPLPRAASPTSLPIEPGRPATIPPEIRPASRTNPGFGAREHVTPALSRTITAPRTITERDRTAREIEALIAQRLAKLDQRSDYFSILGLPFEAPSEAVRTAYIETSRKLHPESLVQVGIADDARSAQRVMAQVNAAFAVLNDSQKRREYINACRRGEPTPIAPRARTGELDKTELAEEAFTNGETALKREDIPLAVEELGRAVTLAPQNFAYLAAFAWARFCAASNKQGVYVETRKALEKAINRSDKPVTARFYLGRVERILGHDREALNHFQEVLLDEPNNKEAASELRFLENRIAKGTGPKR